MKTYVITLSKTFMKGHPKAGESTLFRAKFIRREKIHTIRDNYELWQQRIKEVQSGKAILSVREWAIAPYKSKQLVIKNLTSHDGVGIQLFDCKPNRLEIGGAPINWHSDIVRIAANDGLSYNDFNAWFDIDNAIGKKAIIHFTPFRYYF